MLVRRVPLFMPVDLPINFLARIFMLFCPTCDNILLVKKKSKGKGPVKKILYCTACNHEEPYNEVEKSYTLTTRIARNGQEHKTVILLTEACIGKVTEDDREANEFMFEGSEFD